jgi:predicted signal transduction protein with EAL and GGDEF domain
LLSFVKRPLRLSSKRESRTLHFADGRDPLPAKLQFERVKAEGCTQALGYLFGRPKPASEVPGPAAGNPAPTG